MNAPRSSLWGHLREMLFEDAPAERAREWASGLAYANWQRATVLAAVTAPVAVVFGLLPDLVLWQRGWAQIKIGRAHV